MPKELPQGLYERLITEALQRELLQLSANSQIDRGRVDPAEGATRLARHLARAVEVVLQQVTGDDRGVRQAEIINSVLALAGPQNPDLQEFVSSERLLLPLEELRTITVEADSPLVQQPTTVRPRVPLSASDLLVNARKEPGLIHCLADEIPSADEIDVVCAFVRWHGLRLIADPLAEHCRRGRPLRVITTVYTGSTERQALDRLVALGADVKVSYDTESTRLHAKAWRFHRRSGYSTAYVGSSNLTKSAMVDGVEWNVRLSEVESPRLLEKFKATFDSYWADNDYEAYDPATDRDKFDDAVSRAVGEPTSVSSTITLLDLEPRPYQSEMLETLAAERERHGRHRNLVVAATGTGKTVVAAFDYASLCKEHGNLRLLFIAHRREILRQSMDTFRHVLHDATFGEQYVDGQRPERWDHVFASVQSLSQLSLEELHPTRFDVVIVDEFHHSEARTYRRLLSHLAPKELLGLTATPERADGESILVHFDGRIAVELRLWDALEKGLLAPFHYFGLSDNTDLSVLQWSRKGYEISELESLYTADDHRVNVVLRQITEKLADPTRMKALGFCVSKAHAEFMADRFRRANLAALAVTADTDSQTRTHAVQALKAGTLRAIFSVDVFNEGVDIPSVDTLLFLRPTESPVVFMQQLGRGLRRDRNKDCVTVLDFIGKPHDRFRFDLRYRGITGATRAEVEAQIIEGFPVLPAGCTIQLDRIAQQTVLASLRSSIPWRRPAMVNELKQLARARSTSTIGLAEFLAETRLDLRDVYKSGSWTQLKRDAGLHVAPAGNHEDAIAAKFGRLLHTDDDQRIQGYRQILGLSPGTAQAELREALFFSILAEKGQFASVDDAFRRLASHPALTSELAELLAVLQNQSRHVTYPLDSELGWRHHVPLSVHAQHSTDDIFTAFGLQAFDRPAWKQVGVVRDERTNSDLFLVTLEKSEREYSPSTLYNDYAISPTRFHWQSQSRDTLQSQSTLRYVEHRKRGGNIILFVRQRKKTDGWTEPYTCLGPVDYVWHGGERPVNFIWELRRPMPGSFFREAKVAAG